MFVHHHHETHMAADPRLVAHQRKMVGKHSPVVRSMIGAWRWPIIEKHGDRIQKALVGKRAIDFGGLAGPIGYGSIVVDYQNPHNQPRSLWDIAGQVDTIFASHTVEHLIDARLFLETCFLKVGLNGTLIVQVPSWKKENLRADNWDAHEQTFCLEGEDCEYVPIDGLIKSAGFEIELVDEFQGNLLVIARL